MLFNYKNTASVQGSRIMKHSTKTEMKKTHLIKGLFCCVGAIQKYSLQLSSWYVCHIRAQKGNDKCCKYSTAFHERGQPNCVSSGSVPTSPEKFENAAFFSTVRPTVHTNPSRKRSFSKTLLKPEEFENAAFSFPCRGRKTF